MDAIKKYLSNDCISGFNFLEAAIPSNILAMVLKPYVCMVVLMSYVNTSTPFSASCQ